MACDAACHSGFDNTEGRKDAKRVERALFRGSIDMDRLCKALGYEEILHCEIVAACAAQSGDAPGVQDRDLRSRYRDPQHVVHQGCAGLNTFLVEHRPQDEKVGLLTSTAETPAAAEAVAARGANEPSRRANTTRHDWEANRTDECPDLRRVQEASHETGIECDHHVPTGCAIGVGDLLDRMEHGRNRRFAAAKRSRKTHREKPGGTQRVDHRRSQPAAALSLVGVAANKRGQHQSGGNGVNGGGAGTRGLMTFLIAHSYLDGLPCRRANRDAGLDGVSIRCDADCSTRYPSPAGIPNARIGEQSRYATL